MHKIKIYLTTFLLLLVGAVLAQQINKAEYFWDIDPGVNNATVISGITAADSISKNFSISVSGLSIGTHRIYIRVRATNGKWSIADSRPVFITSLSSTIPQISKAEYFIDTDPGVGNGIVISGITSADSIAKVLAINLTGISVGLHRLYIRARNTSGVWSIADSRPFIVTAASVTTAQISKAEYFIDTDPGVGNGTAVTGIVTADSISKNLSITLTGLSVGQHRLYIRVRNTSGVWSIVDSRNFTITSLASLNIPKINKAEYFFDTDPGVGNGTAIAVVTPVDSISTSQNLVVSSLSAGIHRVYFRVRNANGVWSIVDGRNFTVLSTATSTIGKRRIKKAEYFFDTDPGVGNGTLINTGAYADSVSISNLNVPMSGLTAGAHKVFVRAMDSTNVWSIVQGKAFNVCADITYPNFTYSNGCTGSVMSFTNTSTGNGAATAVYNWSFGDNGVSNGNSPTHIYTSSNTYNVTLIASNGGACTDTITLPIVITTTPPTNAVTVSYGSQPLTFCAGNNVLLTASTSVPNVTYQWQNNSNDIAGETTTQYNVTTTGTYRCKITNQCGSAYSTAINVVVNSFPAISVTPPTNTTICSGATLTLIGSVTGATSQNWYKDGTPISGATGNSLAITVAGDYALYATNSCGTSQSITYTITVLPLVPAAVSITSSGTTICNGDAVTFTATPTYGGTAPTYQWKKNGVNISGATGVTFTTTTAVNGDLFTVVMTSNANCVTATSATSNALAINVTGSVAASVTVSATSTNICTAQSVTFTANPTGGGATPTYQWKKNGVNINGEVAATYISSTLANNDLISVVMTSSSGCATGSPATSTTLSISVGNAVSASIGITSSSNNICQGSAVTFTASPVNGGSLATYQWKLNGVDIAGAASLSYSSSNLSNNDVIAVVMTTSLGCATGSPATSNAITLTINSNIPASVIIASNTVSICSGTVVNFTSTPTNGGTNPTSQWKKNGISIAGATSANYSTSNINDNDIFSLVMTSNANCAVGSPANSNSITIGVGQTVTADVTVSASSNTICPGQTVTFTANPVGGGSAPTYQWYLNTVLVPNISSATYSNSSLQNNDQIIAIMTSNAGCTNGSPATSAPAIIIVTSQVSVAVNIVANATTICAGASVVFTATPTNGGTTPSYQWKKNNVIINSAIGANYTTTGANNNDIFTCEMVSSSGCASGVTATSNAIAITVNANVAATAFIIVDTTSICSGSVANFNVNTNNGGTSPTYQWKRNGIDIAGANASNFSTSNINDNDIFSLTFVSNANCVSNASVNSNSITMTVGQTIAAGVSITSSSTAICANELVTFIANPIGGGLAPTYLWKLNGVIIPAITSSIYSSNSLQSNDQIVVTMTSNAVCTSGSPVTSIPLVMVVSSSVTAAVNIATVANALCAGTQVTFDATPTNGGANPTYQWKKNGVNISSAINANYTTSNINNLDDFTCEMVSSSACAVGGTAVSNNITMQVTQNVTAALTINTASNAICAGDNVNFYATPANGLNSITYQWLLNGVDIPNATNQILSGVNFTDADLISAIITSNDNCVTNNPAYSNIINLQVNVPVVAGLTIASNASTICAGAEATFTAYASNGGANPQYTWSINGITILGENAATFTTSNLQNGDAVSAQLISNAACISGNPANSNSLSLLVNTCVNAIAVGNIGGSPFCNSLVILVPFTSGGIYNAGNIYTAQISNSSGSFANPISIGTLASVNHNGTIICTIPANAAPGNGYRIRVVSSLPSTIGTDNGLNLGIINSDFNLAFTANNTTFTNAPFGVTFTNSTPNANDYSFVWFFGDGTNCAGATPPVHFYPHNGNFSVSMLAVNLVGCTDTLLKPSYIQCSGSLSNCNQVVNITPGTAINNACLGGNVQFNCTTNANIPTYQWNINGLPIGGETQPSFTAHVSGYYSVTVYTDGNCPVTSTLVPISFSNTAPQAPTISSVGNVIPCVGGSQTLTASSGFSSYLWNNGATTQTINVTQSGYYVVTGINAANNGCAVNSDTLTISSSFLQAPDICLVTVDTTLGNNKNLIFWDKSIYNILEVDSFIILKEGIYAGVYNRIGAKDYSQLSEFTDVNSNSAAHADRYKIAIKDSCGNFTLPSTHFKTMHLQITPGVGLNRNLSWTHFEGIQYPYYYVIKRLSNSVWTLLDSVQSNINTYTDLTTTNANVDYIIDVKLAQPCFTSKSFQTLTVRSTSNQSGNQKILPSALSDGINEYYNLNDNVVIVPNPSNGKFGVRIETTKVEKMQILIYDASGQVVMHNTNIFAKGNTLLPIEISASGIYLLMLKNENGIAATKKVVVY